MQCPSVPDEPGIRCDSPVRYFLHLEKSELHELSTAGCALSEGVSVNTARACLCVRRNLYSLLVVY